MKTKHNNFSIISFMVTILIANTFLHCQAKKDPFKKVKDSQRLGSSKNLTPEIEKNKFDLEIDDLLSNTVGQNYRRALVSDLYPYELTKEQSRELDFKQQVELMDYFNYARKDLENISEGPLLKVIKLNFDGNALQDYAIVTHNEKLAKNFLLILNKNKVLYKQEFEADYLEPVNGGRFPVTMPFENKRKTVYSPCIRLIAFDGEIKVMYFDRKEQHWVKITQVSKIHTTQRDIMTDKI